MKTILISLMVLLGVPAFASDDVLATFDTPSGEPAFLYTMMPVKIESSVVSLGILRVEHNYGVYRIAAKNAKQLMEVLCYNYKTNYPYTYYTVETRDNGFLGAGAEPVMEYDPTMGLFIQSYETEVINYAFCQSSPI